jgi:hypothetical protein
LCRFLVCAFMQTGAWVDTFFAKGGEV